MVTAAGAVLSRLVGGGFAGGEFIYRPVCRFQTVGVSALSFFGGEEGEG